MVANLQSMLCNKDYPLSATSNIYAGLIYGTVNNNHFLLNGRMRGWPVLAHHVAG